VVVFGKELYKIKSDRYKKARGGWSRIIKLHCVECGEYLFDYQKDGAGILKRLYFDRIFKELPKKPLKCKCGQLLGIPIIYKKEERPAIRLFSGVVKK